MCFSAEADFVSGAVITGIGLATLAKVEKPRELALGVLPLAFGLHQLVEGFVWLGLHDKISQEATDVAIHLYLAFAWVVLPVLVPVELLLITPDPRRRRVMALVRRYRRAREHVPRVVARQQRHQPRGSRATPCNTEAPERLRVARHDALRRRDVRPAADLVPAAIVWFGICNLGAVARDRVRASRRSHVALVRVGGGGERPDLHAVHGVEGTRPRRDARV